MEEKNNLKIVNNNTAATEQPKISYEQLSAYASQLHSQAEKVFQENQVLKQALTSRDIEYAFKCLEYKELFPNDFIKSVVKRLIEILTPESSEDLEDNKEENK